MITQEITVYKENQLISLMVVRCVCGLVESGFWKWSLKVSIDFNEGRGIKLKPSAWLSFRMKNRFILKSLIVFLLIMNDLSATIELGASKEQVAQIMKGRLRNEMSLGGKEVWIYPNQLSVTFDGGVVIQVQEMSQIKKTLGDNEVRTYLDILKEVSDHEKATKAEGRQGMRKRVSAYFNVPHGFMKIQTHEKMFPSEIEAFEKYDGLLEIRVGFKSDQNAFAHFDDFRKRMLRAMKNRGFRFTEESVVQLDEIKLRRTIGSYASIADPFYTEIFSFPTTEGIFVLMVKGEQSMVEKAKPLKYVRLLKIRGSPVDDRNARALTPEGGVSWLEAENRKIGKIVGIILGLVILYAAIASLVNWINWLRENR